MQRTNRKSYRRTATAVESFERRQLLASVTGVVFADGNRNTRRDIGEAGAIGVAVFADYNYNGQADTGEPVATSAADGSYTLNVAIRPFALTLKTTPDVIRTSPTGSGVWYYAPSADGTGITGWGSTFGVAPAATPQASVSGLVYIDANRNGVQDAAEYAMFRIPVYADYDNNGQLDANEPSTITNDNGRYTLNVAARNFTLRIVAPSGYVIFSPSGGSHTFQVDPNGSLGGTGTTFSIATDQSNLVTATLQGRAFYDTDGDGWLDAGETIAGAGHLVWNDINKNFLFDAPDTSATTDAAGFYSLALSGAPFDMVSIQVTPAAGYATSIVYNHGMMMRNIAGQTVTLDIALRPVAAMVSGSVFADTNRNGRLDAGEAALSGREVFADYNYNGRPDVNEPSVLTDSAGRYNLLTRGSNVSLKVVLRTGESVSLPYGADGIWLSTVNGTVSGKNIGIASLAPMQGTVRVSPFRDANGNGFRDAGEGLIALQQLWADLNSNGKLDASEPRATLGEVPTDAYVLTLPLGTWNIAYHSVFLGQTAPWLNVTQITLTATSPTATFVHPEGDPNVLAFGGNVFLDANGDGKPDTNPRVGVAGQTVFADYNYNGRLDAGEASAITDATGAYQLRATQGNFALVLLTDASHRQTWPVSGPRYVDYFRSTAFVKDFGVARIM